MNEEIENKEEEKPTNQLKSTMPPATAAFFALAMVFLLYQFGGAILTLLVFGFDIENADINLLRLLTMGGQILLILLPSLLFARFVYEDISTVLRVKLPTKKEIGIFTLGFIIISPLLQNYLYLQNYLIDLTAQNVSIVKYIKDALDQLDKLLQSTYGELLSASNIFEATLVILVVALTPALCEEVFFRGFVQKSFEQKYKPYLAIIITAAFFGLYHFNPYGLVALIALGAYFGYAAYKSQSIFIPIILHFLNNFLAISIYLIWGSEELISSNVTASGSVLPQTISFVFLLAGFLFFLFYVNKNYNKFSKKIEEGI